MSCVAITLMFRKNTQRYRVFLCFLLSSLYILSRLIMPFAMDYHRTQQFEMAPLTRHRR